MDREDKNDSMRLLSNIKKRNLMIFSLGLRGFEVIKRLHEIDDEFKISCLIGHDHNICNDYSAETISYCENHNIEYFLDKNTLNYDIYDFILTVAWRWMIYNIEPSKLIVFHDSMLPRYRGFAPVVNALLNYEKEIGVTALLAAAEYDTGNILAQKSMMVNYPTNISKEMERIADLYADLAEDIVSKMANNHLDLRGTPQDESKASYSLWRDEDDYRITWSRPAAEIRHFISCVGYPYKGASSLLNGNLVRIFDAVEVSDKKIENRDCGKTIFIDDKYPVVVCGQGLLKLLDIKDDDANDLLPLCSVRNRFM